MGFDQAIVRTLCVLLCAFGAGAVAQERPGEVVQATVVEYGSASAFAVLDSAQKLKRVKLTGVEAPERKQPFAQQSQRLAAEYLGSGAIRIAIDALAADQRIHGRVTVDGRDVGLVLLESGLAWCDPADSDRLPSALRLAYGQACEQARQQRRGLWQQAHPLPPWEFRRMPQFEPLAAEGSSSKHCREIGYQTLQCDDGSTYRGVGSQIVGSDGTVYTRRGNSLSGSDGSRYEKRGSSVYGSDGSVCRTRGRRVDCF